VLFRSVESLLNMLVSIGVDVNNDDKPGYIKIVDGADHGSIRRTPENAAFSAQMLEYFIEHGHIKSSLRR